MRNTFPTSSTAVLCLVVPAVQAFIIPCIYQSYKCGFNLVIDYGYTLDELSSAVALTPSIPNVSGPQLLQVIYRCINTNGWIAGNSFCFAGCIDMGGQLHNDQCMMSRVR